MTTSGERGFLLRWLFFVRERFPVGAHGLMILFYVSANAAIAFASEGSAPALTPRGIVGAIIILFIFFHLRVLDEIKDYGKDVIVHPERPLPRGLITITEAKRVAMFVIVAEIALGFLISLPTLLATICVIVYSLLMYKEFFIADWLRPRLACYAFTHTVIACWMSLLIYSAFTGRFLWQTSGNYALFLVANVMIFNIFEFGRKTFGREEEKELVESYSKNLGPAGAAASIFFMAAIAVLIGFRLGKVFGAGQLFFMSMGLLLALTLFSSLLYALLRNAFWAKIFRAISALFILLFTAIISLGLLLREVVLQ